MTARAAAAAAAAHVSDSFGVGRRLVQSGQVYHKYTLDETHHSSSLRNANFTPPRGFEVALWGNPGALDIGLCSPDMALRNH
jgi:hypothetical protein